jgi:hypothetical protein
MDRASFAANKRLSTLVDQRFASGKKKQLESGSFARNTGAKHFSQIDSITLGSNS